VPPPDDLAAAVEAVVFAAGEPVEPAEIVDAFEGTDESAVMEALEVLAEGYRSRAGGLRLEKVAGGYRLATNPELGTWVRRFFRHRNRTRLSPAAMETLAIVAYRQPTTSPEIQSIRGVDPSASLKSLLDKKMIRILGKKKVVGSPLLYGTTRHFLVHFGLDSLQDLPSVEDFDALVGALESGESPGAEEAAAPGIEAAPPAGEGDGAGEE
jgi:segregation and condensation protein B